MGLVFLKNEASKNFRTTHRNLRLYFCILIVCKLRILTEKKHRQIKLQLLQKIMDICSWAVSASSQLFIRGSETEIKFKKKELLAKLRSL